VAADFNPNNVAHHAVFDRGNNQPITIGTASYSANYANPDWPRFTGTTLSTNAGGTIVDLGVNMPRTVLPGWILYIGGTNWPGAGSNTFYEVTTLIDQQQLTVTPTPTGNLSGQSFFLTAGLGNAFVPPYGPWFINRCTDCHGSTKSDPIGPHASVNKWLIKSADTDLVFEWFDTTGSDETQVSLIDYGAGLDDVATALVAGTTDDAYVCFNCHRADVYGPELGAHGGGIPNNEQLGRLKHGTLMWDKDGGNIADPPGESGTTNFPQYCRNCHGGDKMGGLHGSNLANNPAGPDPEPQSIRFLNGSTWIRGLDRPAFGEDTINCYTQTSAQASTSNVSTCSQHGSGAGSNDSMDASVVRYEYQGY
jgi:hypothetical protein